ncbi:hypothetical protein ABZV75_30435 [Streptomyces flaveolus]
MKNRPRGRRDADRYDVHALVPAGVGDATAEAVQVQPVPGPVFS